MYSLFDPHGQCPKAINLWYYWSMVFPKNRVTTLGTSMNVRMRGPTEGKIYADVVTKEGEVLYAAGEEVPEKNPDYGNLNIPLSPYSKAVFGTDTWEDDWYYLSESQSEAGGLVRTPKVHWGGEWCQGAYYDDRSESPPMLHCMKDCRTDDGRHLLFTVIGGDFFDDGAHTFMLTNVATNETKTLLAPPDMTYSVWGEMQRYAALGLAVGDTILLQAGQTNSVTHFTFDRDEGWLVEGASFGSQEELGYNDNEKYSTAASQPSNTSNFFWQFRACCLSNSKYVAGYNSSSQRVARIRWNTFNQTGINWTENDPAVEADIGDLSALTGPIFIQSYQKKNGREAFLICAEGNNTQNRTLDAEDNWKRCTHLCVDGVISGIYAEDYADDLLPTYLEIGLDGAIYYGAISFVRKVTGPGETWRRRSSGAEIRTEWAGQFHMIDVGGVLAVSPFPCTAISTTLSGISSNWEDDVWNLNARAYYLSNQGEGNAQDYDASAANPENPSSPVVIAGRSAKYCYSCVTTDNQHFFPARSLALSANSKRIINTDGNECMTPLSPMVRFDTIPDILDDRPNSEQYPHAWEFVRVNRPVYHLAVDTSDPELDNTLRTSQFRTNTAMVFPVTPAPDAVAPATGY